MSRTSATPAIPSIIGAGPQLSPILEAMKDAIERLEAQIVSTPYTDSLSIDLQGILARSPEEIGVYVEAEVSDLDDAKDMLKKVLVIASALARDV